MMDRPISIQKFTRETSMPPATFQLALPVTKLPQTYTLDRAANGIGDCGVTRFKVTD
jgi:hypothetical protein